MVLRGYAAPSKGNNEQVWVFTKQKAYPSSTEGVGAERHFYSELSTDGTQTLDDLITGYEARLGSLLATLVRLHRDQRSMRRPRLRLSRISPFATRTFEKASVRECSY
jgi:hypothetical protein